MKTILNQSKTTTRTTNNYIGIDYSLTSPAITTYTGNNFNIKDCKFYSLTEKKKYLKADPPYYFAQYPDFYSSEEERFNLISDWAFNIIFNFPPIETIIGIEDYSFGSKGRVFGLAENTGLLKHKLWKAGYIHHKFSPSTIKKLATGKGNSTKDIIAECLKQQTGVDISFQIDCKIGNSPSSDIIDSYYVCKYTFDYTQDSTNLIKNTNT